MNRELDSAWLATAEACAARPRRHPSAWMGFIICSLVALLCILGGLAVLIAWLMTLGQSGLSTSEPGFSGNRGIIIGFSVIGVGLLMVLMARQQRRELRRLLLSTDSLRSALDKYGIRLVGCRDVAQWLVRHWSGDYPIWSLASSPEILQATLELDGFACLIDVAPLSYRQGSGETSTYHWWSRVTIAVELPRGGVAYDPNDDRVRRIQARGYEPKYELGGFVARASDDVEKSFKKQPERVTDLLGVAADLATLAKSLGGRPVQPHPV